MTATVSDNKLYEDHAALLGRVTLEWNNCHLMILRIYHTLSGADWDKACAEYFEQNSDHNRRGITQTRIKEVLNTKNDEPMREKGKQLLDSLEKLSDERNLATHTMWAMVPTHTMWTIGTLKNEVRPHPAVPLPEKLEEDFESQFRSLTTKLRSLLRELQLYESGLAVHLEISRARAQENVTSLDAGSEAAHRSK
jgi:hypothetical protein